MAWCNPPYDNEGAWVRHGILQPAVTTFLVPAKTSNTWWQPLWRHATDVVFFTGRMTFPGYIHNYPLGIVAARVTSNPSPAPVVTFVDVKALSAG